MSEWWLGTIVAGWCVAFAASPQLDELPLVVLGLLTTWVGIFATQLMTHHYCQGIVTFVSFIVAMGVGSLMRTVHSDRHS